MVLVSSYCCSPMGLQTPSAPGVLSLAPSLGDPVLHPRGDCKHLLLYLSGTGRASQELAISGSYQQALLASIIVSGFSDCLCKMRLSMDGHSLSLCSTLCLCNSFHGYFVPPSKKDQSIHTLVFLLHEFHVIFELYLGYSEHLG